MSRFSAARAVLIQAIQEHAFPGAAFGVLLRGETLAIEAAGRFTYIPESPTVLPETIFDLASVSKVVATTAMAMLLWERGRLDLDEPVGNRLPEFVRGESPDSERRRVTARMLLAHSSGLPEYARLFEDCRTGPALLDACLRMPLEVPPGSRAAYSDIGFIVLGHLLETIAGERLDRFCRREIFDPLGMATAMYCPPLERRPAIPPTAAEDFLRRRTIQGEVHDENCFVLGGVAGHAGLFTNVADLLRFAGCLLRGGSPIFRSETVSLFSCRQSEPRDSSRALGWDTPSEPSSTGHFFSVHSAGHLGYTGTSLWIDFDKELAVVLLTNRTFPGKTPGVDFNRIREVRPRFHDAILAELGFGGGA
jgi:CubicO group peptidase (beta-lactamase class C family)